MNVALEQNVAQKLKSLLLNSSEKKKMDRKLASENALSSFYHFHQNFLVAYVSITI